jgi:succinoglycan biosynthesis transport protein ExoP
MEDVVRPQEEEIDVRRLLSLIRQGMWLLILCAVLAAGAAFGFSRFQTPIYEARTQVMVGRSSAPSQVNDVTQLLNVQQLAQTYAELMSQDWIRNVVASRVGEEITPGQVSVKVVTNTSLINITVQHPDPQRASLIADTFVKVLVEQNEEIQSQRYAEAERSLNDQIGDMEKQIAALQAQVKKEKQSAYQQALTSAQQKIQDTQEVIDNALAEIARLKALGSTANARARLNVAKTQEEQLKALLENQQNELEELRTWLEMRNHEESEPGLGDAADVTAKQARLEELSKLVDQTQQQLNEVEQTIAWLTPLAEPGAIGKAIAQQEKIVSEQQSLLAAYQDSYARLLASSVESTTSTEVANLEKQLGLYQQIYLSLLNNRETVRLQRMQNMPNVVQITPALPSDRPVRPRTLLNTVLGGIGGFVLALVFMIVRDTLDLSLKSPEDVERITGLPILAYVPWIKTNREEIGPYVEKHPRSPFAEAFRSLRTNLEFLALQTPVRVIQITSPEQGEGKSTVALNLASVISQGGKRTLVLDADLRRPNLHRLCGISNRVGISDLFRHTMDTKSVIRPWDGNEKLLLITSGSLPPNPTELLGSSKMKDILTDLCQQVNVVIVDSPPNIVADSAVLASAVDGVVLVVTLGKTRQDALRLAVEQLRRANARLLGVVLNLTPSSSSYSYYHYAYSSYTKSGYSGGEG